MIRFFTAIALATASLAPVLRAAETRPNIIFILADDLGWKDVGYAGSSFYRTPNIDRLARGRLPLRPQQHVDGVSLLPLLTGASKLPERPLVFHFPHYTHATGPNTVLVENYWKLIRFYNDETGRHLLYHLAEDPLEQHDLSAEMPDKAKVLDGHLTQLLGGMEAQLPGKNPAFDPQAKKLMNRQFTLDLATKEHRMHATRLSAAGLSVPQRGNHLAK